MREGHYQRVRRRTPTSLWISLKERHAMKAVVCTKYGPPEVLQLRELGTPAPKHDEVRIQIHATAVTSSDCIIRSLNVPASMWIPARLVVGITKPRKPVLG